jgi:hypothetical protein
VESNLFIAPPAAKLRARAHSVALLPSTGSNAEDHGMHGLQIEGIM